MLVGISVDIYAMVGEAAISLCRLGKGRFGGNDVRGNDDQGKDVVPCFC